MKVFDPKTLVVWYQLKEQTKNSEKSDVNRLTMASVAVTTGRAQLAVQARTVENPSVVNGHSMTSFRAQSRGQRPSQLNLTFPRVAYI